MIAPGTRLGPFEVLARLGAGGMGEVWRARDTKLDREVALKFLPASFGDDAERLARFEREAKVLASLNHPNIAAIYGLHEQGGHPFLAMELVPGIDLSEKLKHGRVPLREAVDIALQICDALEVAHERGVVHRDLKPANIRLTPEGKVKVLDFGLAKAFASSDPTQSPTITSLGTASGVILGTAAYMSPEAARGRTVDKRTDVWAFGCILFEMLSGKLAFLGETVSDTMAAVLTRDPDWSALSSDTPVRVRELLGRCLQKDPKDRLRDIGDGGLELREALRPGPVVRSAGPRGWVWGLVALLPVAAALLAGLSLGRRSVDVRPPVFRPLITNNGPVYSARLTPDGETVIYGGAFEGRPLALFSMRADGLEGRPIDVPSADIAGISRNSQMALILGRRHTGGWPRIGTLAQVALTGGTPRELLEDVYDADISPDGSQFAVVVADGDDQVLQYPIGKEVYRRSNGWISQPRIAPDGRRIVFVDHRLWNDDLGQVRMIDADGKVLDLGPEAQYSQGACWSPDGKTVWYTHAEDFAGGVLLAVEPGGPTRVVARVPAPVRVQDVTADGRVLLLNDDTWVTLSGELAGDTSERVYTFWVGDGVVGIGQDGVSYAGTDNVVQNGEYSVFFRRGSSAPIRLGPGNAAGLTPDGKFVLATSIASEKRGLTMMPVGAGQPRELDLHGVVFQGHSASSVHFSADGRRFAFLGAKPGEKRAAWVFDLEDGVPRKVSPEGANAAVISPDGARVVVTDSTRGMYVVAASGSADPVPVPVPGAPKEEVPLVWMRDGSAVLSWDRTLPPRIFKTDLASGRRELFRELTPADPAGTIYEWLVLSPDGRHYLQRSRRMRTAVVLVTLHG